MNSIQLELLGIDSRDELAEVFSDKESGLQVIPGRNEYEFRQPLASQVGDITAVVGIVISAAQLAITLYKLMRSTRKSGKAKRKRRPKGISIVTPQGRIDLSGKSVEEIRVVLEAHEAGHDK